MKNKHRWARRLYQALLVGMLVLPMNAMAGFGQIRVQGKSLSMKEIIRQIEKNSQYTFFYKSADVENLPAKTVNIDGNIETVLEKVFGDNNIQYKIKGNEIILTTARVNQGKKVKITGLVTDKTGEPVIGASVIEKGNPSNGTITNVDGKYSLSVPEGATLTVSYVGYASQEVRTKAGVTSYKITLQEDSKLLNEVVVVGYGTQKKVNMTGSVATVNTEDIKDRVQPNVLSAVQGTTAGVTVISRPGQAPSINFRGRGNLGTSAPLYVIDGTISDASFFSNLDPNSIESISFLKDAASSAIYGSRAAYGVVLVTTKQGKEDRFHVQYNGYYGWKNPTYKPEYVNSWEYAELYNEAMYNTRPSGGKNQAFSEEEIAWFKDGSKPDLYPNTNWSDLIFRENAPTTQHSLSFTGGSKKIRYYSGLGYLYDTEFLKNRNKKRYNFDMNVSSDITSWLTFNGKVKYIFQKNKINGGTPSMANMLIVPSTFVAKQSNGEWGSVNAGKPASQTFYNSNPLRAYSNRNWNEYQNVQSLYEVSLDIKPIKDLVITTQGTYQTTESKNKSYSGTRDAVPSFLTPGTMMSGSSNDKNNMSMDWSSLSRLSMSATATYNKLIGIHNLGVLLGTSYEENKFENLGASRDKFPTDGYTNLSGGAGSGPDYKNWSKNPFENKMLSYFSRVTYSLLDRYLLEANFRADASSRFDKDHRWGYFPSFSAGWRISEEPFMNATKSWLDNLKLRASYGSLGNINNVGNYDYFAGYAANINYTFSDTAVKGIQESKPANSTLSWEKVTMSDVGIDIDLFKGKLSMTTDFYVKKTKDILRPYNVPYETGISNPPSQNIANVRNIGFELSLNHRNNIGKLEYSIGGNLSINKNKITNLGSSNDIIDNMAHGVAKFILRQGEAIGSFYGFKTDGLYTEKDIQEGKYYKYANVVPNPGDIKYVPQRNIKYGESLNDDDRTIIGNDVPNVTYGLNLGLNYRNFELSVFGQGVCGTKVAFEVYQLHPFFHGQDNPRRFHMKRWTEANPNPHAVYPRIYEVGNAHTAYNRAFSEYSLFDSDYFRIKTITFGYKVPKHLLSKLNMSAMKVFFTGENLFTFRADHSMKDFDPETAGSVIYTLGSKSVAFGVNVTF